MDSFLKGVPEQYHKQLREAIEAVQEGTDLLRQVKKRFGTNDPDELKQRIGETVEDVTISEDSVSELISLHSWHEQKRVECQNLLDEIGKGTV